MKRFSLSSGLLDGSRIGLCLACIENPEKTGDPIRRRVLYSDLRVRILNIV